MNKSGFAIHDKSISAWWDELTTPWRYALIFTGFLGFFLLLLLPIPLSGSILGTVDSLFIPAISNTYIDRIEQVFLSKSAGQSMYPADIVRFGESSFGIASVFIVFRAMGFNDIYALYLTQVGMLSLLAFATVLLARQYMQSIPAAVFAAFVFSTSNFLWADVDHLLIHFYFFPLVSAYFLKLAIRENNSRYLLAAGMAGGIQMYFSVQVYIYQTLILAVISIFSVRELWKAFSIREKSMAGAAYAFIPLPLFLFYLNTVINLGAVDAFQNPQFDLIRNLRLADLLQVLPNKLITYPFTNIGLGGWPLDMHSAFVGVGAPALALLGLKSLNKHKLELLTLGLLGLLFSLGATIDVAGRQITSPLWFFYEYVPLANYLRVGLRGYSIALLAVSILAGMGWERVSKSLQGASRALPSVGLILAFLFVAAENISWPLNQYETMKYPAIPKGYVEFFRDKPEALILDLPSHSTIWPNVIDEIIYILWQTKHERNILGGINGYLPPSRMEAQRYADQLPTEEAFRYFQDLGVTHFVWHTAANAACRRPYPPFGCDLPTAIQAEDYSWLDESPFLKLVFEMNKLKIYELRPPGSPQTRIPAEASGSGTGASLPRQ